MKNPSSFTKVLLTVAGIALLPMQAQAQSLIDLVPISLSKPTMPTQAFHLG